MNLFGFKPKKTQKPEDENKNSHLTNNSCEIIGEDKAIIAYARVASTTAATLYLEYNRIMTVLDIDTPVTITVYREGKSAVLVTGKIVTATTRGITVSTDDVTELLYVRSSFRTRVFIPGRIYFGDPDEKDSFEQDVMIDDISINGVMMSCPAELEVDSVGVLEFRLPADVLYLPIIIRRCVERQDSVYMKYGGEFCEPSVKQSNTVSHFIFQLTTAMRQHGSTSTSDYRLFKKAWNSILEWEKGRHGIKPSMLNRYNRKSIAGQNNFFKRKNFTNRNGGK